MNKTERAKKAQEGKARNRELFSSQTIPVNNEWKIIRKDEHNWQILSTKKPIYERFYYGSLLGAFQDLDRVLLDSEAKNSIADVLEAHKAIVETIDKALMAKLPPHVHRCPNCNYEG